MKTKCFRYSAIVRNLIAYADFLTMAAIAVTRSLGYILSHHNLKHFSKRIFAPKVTFCACIAIWLLAFLIQSPITFSLTIGKYYFGTFGYDVKHGKCEAIQCETSEGFYPGGFIFSIAFFVPFLFLLISHVMISAVLEMEKRRTERGILAQQSQVYNSNLLEDITGILCRFERVKSRRHCLSYHCHISFLLYQF